MTPTDNTLVKSSASPQVSLDACLTVPPGHPPNVEQIRAVLRLLLTANEIVSRNGRRSPTHAEPPADASGSRVHEEHIDMDKLQTLVRHLAWLEASLAARTNVPNVAANTSAHAERIYRPRLELFESPATNNAVATLELPGMHRSEVQIVMRDSTLVVSGERRARPYEFEGTTTVDELKYGKLTRAIPLPPDTEPGEIRATMEEGMLTVRWPLRSQTATDIGVGAAPIQVS